MPDQTNTLPIFDHVTEVNGQKEYWYIRTDGDEHYPDFTQKGYIGLNWNFISASEIREDNIENLRASVIFYTDKYQQTAFDNLDPAEKSSVTKTINRLFAFRNLKKGDIVLIPCEDPDYFNVGEIADDSIYHAARQDLRTCDYIKRRKVNWLKTAVKHNYCNSLFYSLKHAHQTIVSIKKHADFIDSLTEELYLKDGDCFLSLRINKESEINLKDLKDLFDNYIELISRINQDFGFGEKIDATTVKLSLNSPGFINIKLPVGKSLILTSLILSMFLNGCSDEEISMRINRESIPTDYTPYLDSIQHIRKNLEVENDSIFYRLMNVTDGNSK
jgi:restriction system protein